MEQSLLVGEQQSNKQSLSILISKIKISVLSCIQPSMNVKQKSKFNDFGSLTSFKEMEAYFSKCRLESRENLMKRLNNYDKTIKKQQVLSKLQSSREYLPNKTGHTFSSTLTLSTNLNNNFNLSTTSFMNHNHNKSFHSQQFPTSNLQSTISNTFNQLIEWGEFDFSNPVLKEMARIFNLNLTYLQGKTHEQKRVYVLQKIHEEVQKIVGQGFNGFQTSTVEVVEDDKEKQTNPEEDHNSKQQAFEWLGTNTPYKSLKPIFQEILMERVKLFDNQLSELTHITKNSYNSVQEILTTARTIDYTARGSSGFKRPQRNIHSLTNLNRKKQLKKSLQDPAKGFCDIKIRDQSTFSLQKWTKKQEKQFQQKRAQYKARESKIQNNPILFQFVKKYTKTVKARDNIYKKWQNRQRSQITPQQLKYLCATSLFLNQTLSRSQKQRYIKNTEMAGKRLISRLEFNIAEHIIETYKIFMKKVFDLRAEYYEELTAKRKQEYTVTKKKQDISDKARQRLAALQKNIKMFRTIVNSEKMQLLMNGKILRWVVLFCEKLKQKAKIDDKKKNRSRSLAFVKKLESKKVHPFILAMKKASPAAKILKRQNHENFRPETKKYVQSERFYYEPSFQQTINKFNSLKPMKGNLSTPLSYRKQLSGGPKSQTKKIIVNLSKKTVILQSKKCLQYIIKIQTIWRKHYYRRIYLKMRQEKQKREEEDFQKKYDRLWRIYPLGKKINYDQIRNRLKRFSMRIRNLAKPYVRNYKKPINLFTSFSKYNFTLPELKLKYAKMSSRRLGEFINFVEQNHYSTIIQNSYVITEKEINSPTCKQGATVLWWAVHNSNFELTKKLLQGGGNPNAKNQEESYVMHEAMKNGDIEIIFILLDYGGDLNVKNSKKQTPLYFCSSKMLKLLGLQEGVSTGDGNLYSDNNRIFYRPEPSQIYLEHYF